MYYKVASIVLNSEQKTSTSSDIFIAQPDAHKESLAGKLFILIEIESSKTNSLKLTNFLINSLSTNYYQNEKILLRESIDSIKIENIFQDCLSKTNHALVDFLEQEKIKISPYAFNVNVAVIHDNELHFSSVGKHKNLLIYKEKEQGGSNHTSANKNFELTIPEYKISNIGSDNSKKTETVNINKLFSDITSGNIPGNGYLLMINEALSEYMSNKQLLKIVTKLSPAGAAEQIKNTLSQINAYVSFLGIIIKNSTNNEITHEDIKKELEEKHSKYSNKITSLEAETEKIMAPAGVIDFKKITKSLLTKTSSIVNKFNDNSSQKKKIFVFKDHVFFKKRKNIFKSVHTVIKNIARNTAGILALIFKPKLIKIGETEMSIGPLKRLKRLLSKKEQEGGLKKRNKIILTLAVIFLLVFMVNLFNLNKKNRIIAEQKAFEELALEIEKNQNKIDANLLYNNEDNAKKLIEETHRQISEIENMPTKNTDKLNSIYSKENEQIKNIRKITSINLENQIADFSILNSEAQIDNLILYNNSLYLADAKEKAVYRADLEEQINTANNNLPNDLKELKFPTTDADQLYYLNQDKFIAITKDNQIKQYPLALPPNSEIVAMKNFNNSIYLLNNDQINRIKLAGSNPSEPEPWLQDGVDISGSADIFIDGFIYVLKNNGQVEKLLRGQKQDFKLDDLYLPMTKADKIISSVDSNHIYISELSNKRLAVFNKEGEFIMQYEFIGQDNINDIVVDEAKQKIYILAGTLIFEENLMSTE